MLKRRHVVHLATAALLLGFAVISAPAWAQDPSRTDSLRLAIGGYDPVAYFTDGQPLLGKPEFEHAWDGARYRFVSAQHMTLFRANPDRFAPQFAGSCAMAMSRGSRSRPIRRIGLSPTVAFLCSSRRTLRCASRLICKGRPRRRKRIGNCSRTLHSTQTSRDK